MSRDGRRERCNFALSFILTYTSRVNYARTAAASNSIKPLPNVSRDRSAVHLAGIGKYAKLRRKRERRPCIDGDHLDGKDALCPGTSLSQESLRYVPERGNLLITASQKQLEMCR